MVSEKKRFSKRHWVGMIFLMIVLAVIAITQGDPTTDHNNEEHSGAETGGATLPEGLHPEFGAMYDSDGNLGQPTTITYNGFVNGVTVSDLPLTYVEVDGVAVYQGDILLAPSQPMQAGLGITPRSYLWPDRLVPYEIHSNLPNQERVTDAIKHWEEHTSLRFVERTSANAHQYPNYILFRPGNGCSSYVGMQGKMQPINLASACSTGNTIHEIGHAIGLWHEQSRSDRDEYVDVRYENIISLYAFNFDKQEDNGQDLGEYDYGSIMHYPRWAFSRNGKDTIVPLDPNAEIGQRDGLSADDIAAVEEMYAGE